MIAPSKPHHLIAPIDTSKLDSEKKVKALIKQLLDFHGWFHWMPPANGYGTLGVHDHNAVKDGVFLTVEAKCGRNKPTPMQCSFAAQIIANDCFSFCVNEKNINHFAMWLESFEIAKQHQMKSEEVPQEHGARLLNAISALTDMFQLEARPA
jgi:hypothetical protein